jgi:hypothetical protein
MDSKRIFVKNIESQLKISEMQWNEVTQEDLNVIKLPPNWKYAKENEQILILFRLQDVISLVREVYQSSSLSKSKSLSFRKSQFVLKTMLKSMFPNEGNIVLLINNDIVDVLEDYRHPDITTKGGQHFELDFFYPKLKIAFEYQVPYFYIIH